MRGRGKACCNFAVLRSHSPGSHVARIARNSKRFTATAALLVAGAAIVLGLPALAASPPPIRVSPANPVPSCVTPDRLMAFLRERNSSVDSRFRDIAGWYQTHGRAWRVRWDYAFYQMVVETNYLMFQRSPGVPGDVKPSQNNFAGIGTTGGGVPGDSYRDVSTGVLAQIQHLVVYSGERVAAPVAPRTRLKQDDILGKSLALGRPVTWADLAGRWAADKNYWRSIDFVAERFRAQHCSMQEARAEAAGASDGAQLRPVPAAKTPAAASAVPRAQPPIRNVEREQAPSPLAVPDRSGLGGPARAAVATPKPSSAPAASCKLLAASYGGRKTMLIAEQAHGATHYHIVTVLDGFERSMTEGFIKSRAPGGVMIGEFGTREEAHARARELCPSSS